MRHRDLVGVLPLMATVTVEMGTMSQKVERKRAGVREKNETKGISSLSSNSLYIGNKKRLGINAAAFRLPTPRAMERQPPP